MLAPVAIRRTRTAFILIVSLFIVLLVLAQVALVYLSARNSSLWYWLAGTPLCYFFVSALSAFWAAGGPGRRGGARIGVIIGIGGIAVAALVLAISISWSFSHEPVQPAPGIHTPIVLPLFGLIFLVGPLFLVSNLLGVALAPLGGLLGGSLKARLWRGEHITQERSSERRQSRTWVVVVVVAAFLALLLGSAFVLFTVGVFTAVR